MNQSNKRRLNQLEKGFKGFQRRKRALVVCDPDILSSLSAAEVEADHVFILPDNGRRLLDGQKVAKGSYIVV